MHDLIVACGAVALVGTAVTVGALVYLHLAPTGLSPVHNAVSQYGISPYRTWYRVQTIATGVAGAALCVGLGEALRGQRVGVVVTLLAVFAASRCVISWFPMDTPGAARTTTGAVHGVLALVAFLSVATAAIRLCRVLEQGTRFASMSDLSRGLGWAMVACLGLLFFSRLSPELRRVFGAVERVLYVAILTWLAVFAVACLSLRG